MESGKSGIEVQFLVVSHGVKCGSSNSSVNISVPCLKNTVIGVPKLGSFMELRYLSHKIAVRFPQGFPGLGRKFFQNG